MYGESFEQVVCSGIQAVKWWANKNPKDDWIAIKKLLDVLDSIDTQHFTLISTVDIYKNPVNVDEFTAIETEGLHPYGLHRYRVEQWVRERFPNALIVRLPGLYGKGLKKNLIYDILCKKDLSGFHENSRFQFYQLDRLSTDIGIASDNHLTSINLAVEPIQVTTAINAINGDSYKNETEYPPVTYDMRTVHGHLWCRNSYIENAAECLSGIREFSQKWTTG